MNKKIKLIIFVFTLGLIISCEDFTEFERDGIVTLDGSIENAADLQRLLLGTYDAVGSYAGLVSFNSISSDELRIGLGNRGQGLQVHSFTLTSSDGAAGNPVTVPTGMWFSLYNVIDNANRVLETGASLVGETPEENELLTQIRGEALALRAWQHFDLLRLFAPSFEPSAVGVPLADRVFVVGQDEFNIPRASVGEVLTLINSDLQEAATIISNNAVQSVNRFNINAIRALQARVALYAGNNTEAANFATDVINAVPLVSGDNYINMFRVDETEPAAGTTETIFQIERDQTDPRVGTIWSDINMDVFFSMSIDLLNEINQSGQDRMNLNLDFETTITERVANDADNTDEWIVGKYLGRTDALISLNNIKVFRSSEMQLIRAEANARSGNLPAARTDINEIRTIRDSQVTTPDTYASMNEALSDILAERRVELAFEGHRFFDLKRFGQGISRIDPDCSGDNGARPATTCDLEAGSFRFTLPIPQDEIFANQGINEADQNTGY